MKSGNSIKKNSILVKELWVIQESDGARKRVAKFCEQDGKLLKKYPSRISCPEEQVEKWDFATETKEAIYYERLHSTKPPNSGYKYQSWETDGKWFVTSHKATRLYKGKPVFEIEDKHLSNGWKTTLKVWPLAKKVHTPPEYIEGRETNIACTLKEIREGDKELEAEDKEYTIEKDRERLPPPILVKRYAHRKNLNILELGPSCRAKVPRALLKEGSGNSYTGLDIGLMTLQKQQELLKEEGGYMALHSRQVLGDFYNAPLKSESAGLIVAIGSLPFSCRVSEEKNYIDVTNEIARLLKKDGEFVLDWAVLEDASPAAVAHLLDLFSLIDSDGEGTSRTLVFRKR